MWTWKWTGPAHRARPLAQRPGDDLAVDRPRAPGPAGSRLPDGGCRLAAPARTGPGLHNASPAQHDPPRLAPCEPGETESTRTRSAPSHLAQCQPR